MAAAPRAESHHDGGRRLGRFRPRAGGSCRRQAQGNKGMIREAEWISGLKLTPKDRELMLQGVNEALADYSKLRAVSIDNSVPPAVRFDPAPGSSAVCAACIARRGEPDRGAERRRPATDEDLAFSPVTELADLIRTRKTSSVELTRVYLDRLRRYDLMLLCVITLTDELALAGRRCGSRSPRIATGVRCTGFRGAPRI